MPEYRLYCLGGDGKISRITKAIEIAAGSDDEAIATAKALQQVVTCELWNRNRLVATIPAHRP